MAYWSIAESINRRSFRIRLAWERFRARKNPGKAMAASNAIIATTIIISTRVNPFRLDGVFIVLRFCVRSIGHADARYDPPHVSSAGELGRACVRSSHFGDSFSRLDAAARSKSESSFPRLVHSESNTAGLAEKNLLRLFDGPIVG